MIQSEKDGGINHDWSFKLDDKEEGSAIKINEFIWQVNLFCEDQVQF